MSQSTSTRTCHRCGKQFTGHFCPCRRHKSQSTSGRSSCSRSGASRSLFSSSSSPTATIIPLWESDPDRFWDKQVDRVRTARNVQGDEFIVAYFGNTSKMFPLADVLSAVEKFWIVRPEPAAVAA